VPAQAACSLLASALIARSLGTSLFGTFAVFNALRASLAFYTDLGMSTAGSKFFPEVVQREGRAGALRLIRLQSSINGLAAAIWIVLLLAGGGWCRELLGIDAEHAYVTNYAAVGLLIEECARVSYPVLWGRFAHHRVNLANLIGTAVLPLLILATVSTGGGLHGVLVATLVSSGLRTLLLWFGVWLELRQIPWKAVTDPVAGLSPRFIRLGAVSWVEKLSGYVYGPSFVTLVFATFIDLDVVGQFALAMEFTVRVLSLVLSPTHGIILPAVSSVFASGTHVQRQRLFTAALRTLGLWLAPAGALLITVTPYVIPAFYSEAFAPAVMLTQILAVFYFAEYAVYSPANSVLLAGERLREYSRIKIVSIAILPAILLLARVATLEIVAAVYGLVRLAVAIALLVTAARVQQLVIPSRFYGRLVAAGIAATVLGLSTLHAMGVSLPAAIMTVLLTTATILVTYRLFGCLGREERDTFERLNLPGTQWVLRFFHV
jgi:O-antigen/teichoic acid export membrane protein